MAINVGLMPRKRKGEPGTSRKGGCRESVRTNGGDLKATPRGVQRTRLHKTSRPGLKGTEQRATSDKRTGI